MLFKEKHLLTATTALVLILSVILMSCGGMPSNSGDEGFKVPNNYTTYTDENKLFSISYPYDWELTTEEYLASSDDLKALNEYLSSNKPNPTPLKMRNSWIFGAYKDVSWNVVPNVHLDVMPLPEGEWTAETYIDWQSQGRYKEYLQERLNVDGRETIVLRGEVASSDPRVKDPYISIYANTVIKNTLWVTRCSVSGAAIDKYERDLQIIVRSLRVLK